MFVELCLPCPSNTQTHTSPGHINSKIPERLLISMQHTWKLRHNIMNDYDFDVINYKNYTLHSSFL